MVDTLKLMAVLAHPDDESLGTGGVLAKYAVEGIETFLATAADDIAEPLDDNYINRQFRFLRPWASRHFSVS
jgi:hypothetical protein